MIPSAHDNHTSFVYFLNSIFFCRKKTSQKQQGVASSAPLLGNLTETFNDLVQAVRERPKTGEKSEDPIISFSSFLATKMRQVPEERRSTVEKQILEIVYENI